MKKRIMTILLAAALTVGAATGAQAIDFKAKGNWYFSFDYGQGSNFMSRDRAGNEVYGYANRGRVTNQGDMFEASQRLRLQLDAKASEDLSGTVLFEIGASGSRWGEAGGGAALGADSNDQIKVKNAYIDWVIPNTSLKVRMGIQNIELPDYATKGSRILDDDAAGIVVSNRFNKNVTATAFWSRFYNDNATDMSPVGGGFIPSGYMDNLDIFGLIVPMRYNGMRVTPWAMLMALGPNSMVYSTAKNINWYGNTGTYFRNYRNFPDSQAFSGHNARQGLMPAVAALKSAKNYIPSQYTTPVWFGLTGEVKTFDPFYFAWNVNFGDNGAEYDELRRSGWYASAIAEYAMPWGTPGLVAWYASGDDGDVTNGSERMPIAGRANSGNDFTNFAGNGKGIMRSGIMGSDYSGTWGMGVRVTDMSLFENLKHTLRVNYIQGTNDPAMAQYILKNKKVSGRTLNNIYTDFNTSATYTTNANNDLYLTTQDKAVEVSFENTYNIYDNLKMHFFASYIALSLDRSQNMWGNNFALTDAWNVNLSFEYSF